MPVGIGLRRRESVSVTVTVQVPPSLIASEVGQSTEVDVLRSWTVIEAVPKLVAWTRLEASL